MQNISRKIGFLSVIIVLLASCKKEGAQFALQEGSFASAALTASNNNFVLSGSNDADTVVTFKWPAVNYGSKVAVSYTIQIDAISDTSGNAAWGKAISFSAGDSLSYSFVGKSLNNTLITQMMLAPGNTDSVAVRVKADVNQYNGSASTVPSSYSNTFILIVTPYALNLYVPGAYQGWDPATAPVIAPIAGKPGLFEGYVNITGTGLQYFKYTSAPDFNHINYGDGGNGTFSTDGNAAGLSVPNGGYYELTADLNNNTWTATATTWSIIGDATPGGWNTDTQMTYDPSTQVWTVTANMIAAGSFKFRANDAWVVDFGIDGNGNLQYADNPFFGYTAGLNDLTVPSDGNYTITLDLHVAGKYTYILQKN
ncbi:MAG TPA: SusE domain-containing protein [Hanamia sp.]